MAQSILKSGTITALRGNASEITALDGAQHITRGVDCRLNTIHFCSQAKSLACEQKCIVTMSGAIDIVTNGQAVFLVHNGHPLMGSVTGMGCTATALMGAFLAINQDALMASLYSMIVMGIVGELAAKECNGPGSFKTAFIDKLYKLSLADIEGSIRVEVL